MALRKQSSANVNGPNEGFGLGLVRSTSFGRKRVCLSNVVEVDCIATTPTKRQCRVVAFPTAEKSRLEALSQDILIRILCGVDHDDLKSLFHVSMTIREATLIAKDWHFEYSTPRKTLGFRSAVNLEDSSEGDGIETPNAPKQSRVPRSRLSGKKLADISVALFTSGDERWPRRELFMEMETEV